MADLHKLIESLGMDDTGDGKTFASVAGQGKDGLTIMFFPYDDGKAVRIYTMLGDLPKDKTAAMPSQKMLAYNNELHNFFFTLDVSDDGTKALNLTVRADAAALTPQIVRQDIDHLIEEVDETRDLWMPDRWAAAVATPAGGSPEALQAAADTAWVQAPMKIQTMVISTKKAEGYGDFTKMSGSEVKRGDALHLYIAPENFIWKAEANDHFGIAIASDFALKTKSGDVILSKKNAAVLTQSMPYKLRYIDFTFNVSLDESLTPGPYVAEVTLRDQNSDKTATGTVAFDLK